MKVQLRLNGTIYIIVCNARKFIMLSKKHRITSYSELFIYVKFLPCMEGRMDVV